MTLDVLAEVYKPSRSCLCPQRQGRAGAGRVVGGGSARAYLATCWLPGYLAALTCWLDLDGLACCKHVAATHAYEYRIDTGTGTAVRVLDLPCSTMYYVVAVNIDQRDPILGDPTSR